jgi:TRAP-type C4-dicarboxylate transport system permease small subunit
MSYAFAIMRMDSDSTSSFLMISCILSEITAALCAYFAYQLALQSINQWLSPLDIACFIVTMLLFIFLLSYGPELWQKHYLKKETKS